MKKIVLGLTALLTIVIAVVVLFIIQVLPDRLEPDVLEQHQANLRAQYYAEPAVKPDYVQSKREPCADFSPFKSAFFGDTHVHTAQSYDASVFGLRLRPDEAYAFAKGKKVELPPYDANGNGLRRNRIDRPLDFVAITDHAEQLAEVSICHDPNAKGYTTKLCKMQRGEVWLPVSDTMKPLTRLASLAIYGQQRPASLCGDSGEACMEATKGPWQETQQAAERWYDRSSDCSFTTFVGYEYSLAENAANLHRNVIFANGTVPPLPLSSKEAPKPSQLWRWLEEQCIESETGCDAIAIPHNSNWSSGRMFHPEFGTAIDRSRRARIERLVEVMQVKGDSECRQGLDGITGTADEFCDYEKLRRPEEPFEDCGDDVGSGGMTLTGCLSKHSYARYALIQGLKEREQHQTNPFQFGLIGSTDTHLGTPGAVRDDDYKGSTGTDSTADLRLRGPIDVPGGIARGEISRYSPGGLAGVWAQENTRESLFSAMKDRETFATSGPRIKPRFFGGWSFPRSMCSNSNLIEIGYSLGVPMGSVLPNKSGDEPIFVVDALADTAANAQPLQRVQIIKGWMDDDGVMHQDVYDVAGGDNTASVDTQTCQTRGGGARRMCGVWRDPAFDPNRPAVYYSRVLENPSCRWSQRQCLDYEPGGRKAGQEKPAGCSDPTLPKTVQERAWTSPIWYYPK